MLEQNGYRVIAEHKLKTGGVVDLYAKNSHKTLIVEVETGKSNVVANVKNCLRSGFDSVVIVATDQPALMKVQRALATVGLLIPGRIDVVLCANAVLSRAA